MTALFTRRRLLNKTGRPMTLTRLGTDPNQLPGVSVTVQGHMFPYSPEKIAGAIRQGDAQVQILDDEIAAAGWPGPPSNGDRMAIEGVQWFVQGSYMIYDGATLIGHVIWIRGGEP